MSPFDPRSVLFAKHAQHVALVHFPIALFITGAVCDLWAHWGPRWEERSASNMASLNAIVKFNLWAAALMAAPTVATGIAAWQWQLEGQRLKGVLLLHLAFGLSSFVLLWLVALMRSQQLRNANSTLPTFAGILEIAGVAAIALTGHLGGFVSGVNLPG
jgi:uncharacterized membrane protein